MAVPPATSTNAAMSATSRRHRVRPGILAVPAAATVMVEHGEPLGEDLGQRRVDAPVAGRAGHQDQGWAAADLVEGPETGEADLVAHLGDRQFPGPQQRLGPLPPAHQIPVRSLSERRLEAAAEV